MTTRFENSAIARPEQAAKISTAVVRYARSLLATLQAFQNRRAMARFVATMDDRMLSDIGLTRHDVGAALSEPLWRDPTARLVSLAEDRKQADLQQRAEKRSHVTGEPPRAPRTTVPGHRRPVLTLQTRCDRVAA